MSQAPDTDIYDSDFYSQQIPISGRSAEQVVPVLIELLHPQSVVDLGCGTGSWLAVFKRQGVPRVQGYDGDYVDRALLEIAPDEFQAADLSQPLKAEGAPYAMALSLEVAEHIEAVHAQTFVDSLTSLAPIVVFSAAIPGQWGNGHVNTQWPSYWAAKFAQRGYLPVEYLRPLLWNNPQVNSYYIQNVLIYATPEAIAANPTLAEARRHTTAAIDLAHPREFEFYMAALQSYQNPENRSLIHAWRDFRRACRGWLRRRLAPKSRR